MLNAVRDNPERVEFVGYDTQKVRFIAFVIAAFFAGISGGLAALNFEIVTSEVVSAYRSGAYLLFTFLGGATFFFGPIIGAVLMVLAFVLLSEFTKAWLLYLGLVFLFMVMYAPGGVASLVMMNLRVASFGRLKPLWPSYLGMTLTAVLALLGAAAMIEMIYHLQLNAALGSELKFLGMTLDAKGMSDWMGAGAVFAVGIALFEIVRRRFAQQWGDIQEYIEKEIKKKGGSGMSEALFALELKNLRKSFGKTEIIRGVELSVRAGERIAVIGPNGAGKSTLFNLISGRFEPTSGDVLLNGKRINGLRPFEINRLGLSRSFQITNIFPKLSVFENLRCGVLWSLGYKYTFFKFLADLDDANDLAEKLMHDIRLEKKRDVLAMNLTYAEQRALEIGITIAGGAGVILLDEPTAGMSKSETSRFINLIKEVTVGKTLLTVEHDMGVVFGLADKIAVVVYGEVIAFDTPDAVRANAKVQEAYLGSSVADAQAGGH
jgi:branched-chain amino acid transport system ATP-binding protein